MHRPSAQGGWRGGGKAVRKPSTKLNPVSPAYPYEHDEIKAGIRELLMRMEPLIKVSGESAPIESMMTYLEELDDAR